MTKRCFIPRARSLLDFNVVAFGLSRSNSCRIEMSFIPVSPENHFPVKNLPYGVFSTSDNVSKLTYFRRFHLFLTTVEPR